MRVKVRGRYWNLRKARLRKTDGWCDNPKEPNKEILISHRLFGEDELRVTLHELFHAGHWDIDEGVVERYCEDVARILWQLGWRRETE